MTDIFQIIGNSLPPALYCNIINVRNRLRRKSHTIAPTEEPGIYKISDGKDVLYICRRARHNRSKRGVTAGVDALAAQYHLDKLVVAPGDLLIDCGANIGELGVWARQRKLDYISYEPEKMEARCCDLNAFSGSSKTNNLALWYEEAELKFFSKPGSADSSLFEINAFDSVKIVTATRLDKSLKSVDLNRRIILKIEAEGAEPEVLRGAKGILDRIAYLTIDCGYERGKEQTHTFVETNNFLIDNGFRVEEANFRRMTVLYRNTRIG